MESLIEDQNFTINELKDKVQKMEEYYNKYSKIMHFENLKIVLSDFVDINNPKEIYKFLANKRNKLLLLEIIGKVKHDNYCNYYNYLKSIRNSLCHPYNEKNYSSEEE